MWSKFRIWRFQWEKGNIESMSQLTEVSWDSEEVGFLNYLKSILSIQSRNFFFFRRSPSGFISPVCSSAEGLFLAGTMDIQVVMVKF